MSFKVFFAIFFTLLCNYGYSQQSISIDYKITFYKNELDYSNLTQKQKDSKYMLQAKEAFEGAIDILNTLKTHLIASRKKAKYWGDNTMPNDVNTLHFNLAKVMVENDKRYYYDIDSGIISKWFKIFGSSFIMEQSVSGFNWRLMNESKQIGGYTCYKAECSYQVVNSEGTFTKKVIAWYAPEISFMYGPKGFCGLPGLILELKDDKIKYMAENITFYNEKVEIESPPKAKVVTQKELDGLVEIAREERRLRLKKKE